MAVESDEPSSELHCALGEAFYCFTCEMQGASAFSEGGRGGGPGARCPLEAPSLMTPCPTPAWPPPHACLLMPATLMGPSRVRHLLSLPTAP